MKVAQAKSVFRAVAIVLGAISAIGGFASGMVYLFEKDHQKDEQFFCAPSGKLDHVFLIDGIYHAVCHADGMGVYLSEKSYKR